MRSDALSPSMLTAMNSGRCSALASVWASSSVRCHSICGGLVGRFASYSSADGTWQAANGRTAPSANATAGRQGSDRDMEGSFGWRPEDQESLPACANRLNVGAAQFWRDATRHGGWPKPP